MKPAREHTTNNAQTYFVTSDTWERRALFNVESWARLFFKKLYSHRGESYLLHEFVLMPDHFHLLITPTIALERAVQLIKGGFSFRAKKELGSNMEIWQRGFADHRIRDIEDYDKHLHYIPLNPVKKHLCASPVEYRYSSAYPGWKLDPIPQGLKPQEFLGPTCGTAEAMPFQSMESENAPVCVETSGKVLKGHDFSRAIRAAKSTGPSGSEGCFSEVRIKSRPFSAACEAVPFQGHDNPGLKPTNFGEVDVRAEARTFQTSNHTV